MEKLPNSPTRAIVLDKNSFGTVTTCRENPKQVREFVNYHLNLGAACMVVYFDDPEDAAMKLFDNEPRVICRACTDAHWQLMGGLPISVTEAVNRNIEDGASLLRERGVSWIAPIDADELLYSDAPIAESLASVESTVDVLSANPMEAVQHRGMREALEFRSYYFREFTPTLLPAQEKASKQYMAGVNEFGDSGCFGHIRGKSLFRATAQIDRYGSHRPRNSKKGLRMIVSEKIVLLHFDAINYASWERKWISRATGESVHSTISERRWRQHNHIKQTLDAGGRGAMSRLFRQWHFYSPAAVAALQRAGLLRKIMIPASRFAGPVKDVSHAR